MKKTVEKLRKKNDGFWADFKKFITKGNVLDLAVAVVIANAFNAIVTGLVKHIITPLVTYATSGVSINEWQWVIREAVLDEAGNQISAEVSVQYGLWLQAIVDFLIIALCIFIAIRVIRKVEKTLKAKEIAKEESEAAAKKAEEEKKAAEAAEKAKALEEEKKATQQAFLADVREQAELLREIRDSLKKQQ